MPVSESMKQRSEIFDYRRKQVHGSTKTEKKRKEKNPPGKLFRGKVCQRNFYLVILR